MTDRNILTDATVLLALLLAVDWWALVTGADRWPTEQKRGTP